MVSALQAVGVGIVGPTAASGWTAVWLPDAERLLPLGDVVSIEEDDDGYLALGVHAGGQSRVWAWPYDPEGRPTSEVEDAARSLCEVFERPNRERELASLLLDAPEAEDIASSLDMVFDLPQLDDPAPERSIAVTRADTTSARMAARILAGDMGRTGFAVLDGGWSVIRPLDAPHLHATVALTLAAGSDTRHPALSLWRGPGTSSGFLLALDTDTVSTVTWNTQWRDLDNEGWERRDAVASALAQHLGSGDDELTELRTLVRARTWHGDPLARLAFLLGLPFTCKLRDKIRQKWTSVERPSIAIGDHQFDRTTETGVSTVLAPHGWRVAGAASGELNRGVLPADDQTAEGRCCGVVCRCALNQEGLCHI